MSHLSWTFYRGKNILVALGSRKNRIKVNVIVNVNAIFPASKTAKTFHYNEIDVQLR